VALRRFALAPHLAPKESARSEVSLDPMRTPVVERILDIVEEVVRIQRPSPKSGVIGSAVIQSRVTEVLDVDAFVRLAEPAFFLEAVGA